MSNTQDIMTFWPETRFEPRPVQVEALQWIQSLMEDGARRPKYMILQAPVASGKSHIAITASAYLGDVPGVGNSFILTPQKILQKQYDDTFQDDLAVAVYGKSNYECSQKNCSCDIGTMIKPACDSCPYTTAVKNALESPNIILNYKLAFLLMTFHPKFSGTKRKLLVVDECHNLEEALISFSAVQISRTFVEREMGITWPTRIDTFAEFIDWTETSGYTSRLVAMQNKQESIVEEIKRRNQKKLSKDDIREFRRLLRLDEMVEQLQHIITTPLDDLEREKVFDGNVSDFTIRNLYACDQFLELLDSRAEHFLFMSGTVDLDGYCKDIGINKDEAAFLSLTSPIDASKRPVVSIPTIRMNYEWLSQQNSGNRKQLIANIETIFGLHPGDSGILHTGNFKVAEWLVEQLRPAARRAGIVIIHHNPDDDDQAISRDDAIAKYLKNAELGIRSILISPSCTEGLDLKDNLGRFSIVVKIPFGNLGDKWIKRRMQLSREWYSRLALFHLMQAAGRVVRGPDDNGVTYILDESWLSLMQSTRKLIPKWWSDGYHRS